MCETTKENRFYQLWQLERYCGVLSISSIDWKWATHTALFNPKFILDHTLLIMSKLKIIKYPKNFRWPPNATVLLGRIFASHTLMIISDSESKNTGFNVFLYGKTHVSYIFHIKKTPSLTPWSQKPDVMGKI
jgi:hypothetical protein